MQPPWFIFIPYVYLTLEEIGKMDNIYPWAWGVYQTWREANAEQLQEWSLSHNENSMSFGVTKTLQ